MEFKYDGGGLAKGGTVSLYVDGKKDRRRPPRRDDTDGLLLPMRPAMSAGMKAPRSRRITARAATGSPAKSTGSSSTWARMITIT